MFKEIRNSFYCKEEGYIAIDAWRTNNQNEEGIVVAKVYKDRVDYKLPHYANDEDVVKKVNEAKGFLEKLK